MSESGITHPFSAKEAWSRAALDPNAETLHAYLRDHPDHYVARALYSETIDRNATRYAWEFLVTDGFSSVGFMYRNVSRNLVPGLAVLTPILRGYEFHERDWLERDRYPPKAFAPAEMPSVAAAWDQWRAISEAVVEHPNTWGFQVDPCQCNNSYTWWAGRELENGDHPGQSEFSLIREHVVDGRAEETEYETRFDGPSSAPSDSSFQSATLPNLVMQPSRFLRPEQATTIGLSAAAAAAGSWVLIRCIPWPMFARLRADRVLDAPRRSALVALIDQSPGIHLREIVRRTKWSKSVVQHHVSALVSAGHIRELRTAGYLCFYPVAVSSAIAGLAAVLRTEAARVILRTVLEKPGSSTAQIARRARLSRSVANYHVGRLQTHGLVVRTRQRNSIAVRPTAAAAQAAAAKLA